MRRFTFVTCFVLASLLSMALSAVSQAQRVQRNSQEEGKPFIEFFDTREMGYELANYACLRDRRGIFWAGNVYGLLEFDGITWRMHESDPGLPAFSIEMANDGTIYFGLFGSFGRVSIDSSGQFKMDLLSDSLPSSAPTFTRVDNVHCIGKNIWFRAEEVLCRWNGHSCTYIPAQSGFGNSFTVNGELYVLQDSIGLCRVKRNRVVLVPDGERFADPLAEPVFMYAENDSDIIIGTRSEGVFRYNGRECTFLWDYDPLTNGQLLPKCGVPLFDGTVAVGTERRGIWIFDANGRIQRVIDRKSGLGNNSVFSLYVDRDQTLWAALNDGIAHIEWPARTTRFTDEEGISGQITAISRFRGTLYATTDEGFYRLTHRSGEAGRSSHSQFEVIQSIRSTGHSLYACPTELLVASTSGLYTMNTAEKFTRISSQGSRIIHPLHGSTDTLLIGLNKGFGMLTRSDHGWLLRTIPEQDPDMVLSISETPDGTIWATTAMGGTRRIRFSDNLLRPQITYFGTDDGYLEGQSIVRSVAGRPLFITEGDLLAFDPDSNRFYPDTFLTSSISFPMYVEPRQILQASNGDVWMQLFRTWNLGRLIERGDDSLEYECAPYSQMLNSPVLSVYEDPDGVCWFGTDRAIYRYDPRIAKKFNQPFATYIRTIAVDGQAVYAGDTKLPADAEFEIDPTYSTILVKIAAPFFTDRKLLQHRWWLVGRDTTWSAWQSGASIEYTDLSPGTYKLRVQSVNYAGIIGKEASVSFSIPVPWFRSTWAIMLYAAMFMAIGFVGRLWYRSRYLVKQSRELEHLVQERTTEIRSQAREIRRQAEELERLDNIVRTVNRETQLPQVLDALLMQSLLLFPHAEMALFVRRDITTDVFRVVAAIGARADEMRDQSFTLRDLVGGMEGSMQRMREGVYLLHGLGRYLLERQGGSAETRFMAMVIERARLLEGFLVLGSSAEDPFGESDLQRLLRLKEHASSAVAKADAIEELERKNDELDSSNRRLVETQRQLVAHEKLAALGELTAGIAHEIQNPLNFVNNFSELSCELLGELEQTLKKTVETEPQTRRLIELIRSNCTHIREHGRRATTIVSAMIMHSRSGMSTRTEVELNDLIDEFVMLAYHGMRIQFPQFTLDLHREYDKPIGRVEVLPQEFSRAIVNICNNAWEAAITSAAEEDGERVPTVWVRSKDLHKSVEITIADNGHGIPDELREKIFEPFFTTRRSTRNAGLGLSLSYDIITQLHKGTLTVQSDPSENTVFRIIIPKG